MPDFDDVLRDYVGWLDDQAPPVGPDEARAATPPAAPIEGVDEDEAQPASGPEAGGAGRVGREVQDLESAAEAAPQGWTRRRATLFAAAAVVTLVALAGGWMALTGADDPTPVEVAGRGVSPLTANWVRVDDPFGGGSLQAMGSNGDELLALVRTCSDAPTVPPGASPPSPGYRDCAAVDPPAATTMTVWTSSAGYPFSWSQVGVLFEEDPNTAAAGPEARDVVWNGQQWLVPGRSENGPVIWTSLEEADGSMGWARSTVASRYPDAVVASILLLDDGAVAGGAGTRGTDSSVPLVWSTIDPLGIRWGDPRVTVETELPTQLPLVGVESLVAVGDEIIAVGSTDTAASWSTTDREIWVSNPTDGPETWTGGAFEIESTLAVPALREPADVDQTTGESRGAHVLYAAGSDGSSSQRLPGQEDFDPRFIGPTAVASGVGQSVIFTVGSETRETGSRRAGVWIVTHDADPQSFGGPPEWTTLDGATELSRNVVAVAHGDGFVVGTDDALWVWRPNVQTATTRPAVSTPGSPSASPATTGADGEPTETLAPGLVPDGDPVPADWELDPSFPAPRSENRTLFLLVTERSCSGGIDASGRIPLPVVSYEDESITIDIGVVPVGLADCPSNPRTPYAIGLSEAFGNRELRGMTP